MLFLITVGLIIFAIIKWNKSNSHESANLLDRAEHNVAWARFIGGYKNKVSSKSEKALIDRMLSDIAAQGFPIPSEYKTAVPEQLQSLHHQSTEATGVNSATVTEPIFSGEPIEFKSHANLQMDNASLLLYFGAFLFVASAGLFVAFSDVSAGLRVSVIAAVSLILYAGGMWLHKNRAKLQPAALAFVGIGMAVAPLTGLAAYNLLFDQTQGAQIWFLTSVVTALLYLHALFTLRKPLLNYIVIFTFLSLFESAVSIVDAPIYYFGWAMAGLGIILSFVSRYTNIWPDFRDSSRESSVFFLPLSLLISVFLVGDQGFGQLGVSLLLAAIYYGVEFLNSTAGTRQMNAIASHVAGILGVVSLTYAIGNDGLLVITVLLILNTLQLLALVYYRKNTETWQNFSTIFLASFITAFFASFAGSDAQIIASLVATLCAALFVWQIQSRSDAYSLAVVAWMALPIVVCQFVLTVADPASLQSVLLMWSLIIQLYVISQRKLFTAQTASDAQPLFLMSAITVVLSSMWAPPIITLLASLVAASTLVFLAEIRRFEIWAVWAGTLLLAPLVKSLSTDTFYLLVSNIIALASNILISLRYRTEINRWISTGLWLLLPYTLGVAWWGEQKWEIAVYAWLYVVVMIALLLSRSVALGYNVASVSAELMKHAKTKSSSYVWGYVSAGVLAILLSLSSSNSQLHTSLIAGVMLLMTIGISLVIEKKSSILAVTPLLAQLLIWSIIRPEIDSTIMQVYLALSTLVAMCSYVFAQATEDSVKIPFQNVAIVTSFVTPLSYFAGNDTQLLMPIGLFISAALLIHSLRTAPLAQIETAGILITIAIFWLLSFYGVKELQAYVHVVVAQIGVYAYLRYQNNEITVSNTYLQLLALTATLPLALQALGEEAGGLYGWWLLLEQVAIMLLGMAIGRSFLIKWGLYVSLLAVLFQLRGLGWAALSILAIFLIGMAVYKIQKYNDDTETKT